jgi:small subunit ribosomal protein S1
MSQQTVSAEAWQEFLTDVRARSFEGTITHLVPFGAILTVGPGVLGLLPAAAMTVEPTIGATLAVRVVEIDEQRRRVSLAAA